PASWCPHPQSLSGGEPAAQIAKGSGVQIVDARAREHMSLNIDLMAGATWRDPDRVAEGIAELKPDKPVAVYCAYGFDVGRNVTKTLIEGGFDAPFLRGGGSAGCAAGGARRAGAGVRRRGGPSSEPRGTQAGRRRRRAGPRAGEGAPDPPHCRDRDTMPRCPHGRYSSADCYDGGALRAPRTPSRHVKEGQVSAKKNFYSDNV